VAWWPVLVSWRIVKEPIETAPSFVSWLALMAIAPLAIEKWDLGRIKAE
jgi:hypothetical protein